MAQRILLVKEDAKAAISLESDGREALLTHRNAMSGLTVAKLLAQQMGGDMEASLEEASLCIRCRLPLSP